MTKKESINRNIGLTFDLLRQIAKDSSVLKKIPAGSTLEFVEKDFTRVERKNKTKRAIRKKYMRVKSNIEII
jgi:hypothetical protein